MGSIITDIKITTGDFKLGISSALQSLLTVSVPILASIFISNKFYNVFTTTYAVTLLLLAYSATIVDGFSFFALREKNDKYFEAGKILMPAGTIVMSLLVTPIIIMIKHAYRDNSYEIDYYIMYIIYYIQLQNNNTVFVRLAYEDTDKYFKKCIVSNIITTIIYGALTVIALYDIVDIGILIYLYIFIIICNSIIISMQATKVSGLSIIGCIKIYTENKLYKYQMSNLLAFGLGFIANTVTIGVSVVTSGKYYSEVAYVSAMTDIIWDFLNGISMVKSKHYYFCKKTVTSLMLFLMGVSGIVITVYFSIVLLIAYIIGYNTLYISIMLVIIALNILANCGNKAYSNYIAYTGGHNKYIAFLRISNNMLVTGLSGIMASPICVRIVDLFMDILPTIEGCIYYNKKVKGK